MSRIGKKIINKPAGVQVIQDSQTGMLYVKGPKGAIEIPTENRVRLLDEGQTCRLELVEGAHSSFWGLYNRLLQNAVTGVHQLFERELELVGTGYRASLEGQSLKLVIGFSHPVLVPPVEGIRFETPQPTRIKVIGVRKDQVGLVASQIRRFRPPEPYHGKGIRYVDEVITLKAGKSTSKK